MEDIKTYFKNKRNFANLLVVLILLLGLPLVVGLVRTQQILKSRAVTEPIKFTGPNVQIRDGQAVALKPQISLILTSPFGPAAVSSPAPTPTSPPASGSPTATATPKPTLAPSTCATNAGLWQSPDMKFTSKVPRDVQAVVTQANQLMQQNGKTGSSAWSFLYTWADQVVGHMGHWLTPQQANEFMKQRPDIKAWWQKDHPLYEPADAIHSWIPGAVWNPQSPDTGGLQTLFNIAHCEDGQGISYPDQILAMFPEVKENIITMMGSPEGSDGWPATTFLREWFKIAPNDPNAQLARWVMSQMPGQVGFSPPPNYTPPKITLQKEPLSWESLWGLVGTVYAGHLQPDGGRFCENNSRVAEEFPGDNTHYFVEDCDSANGWWCQNGQCSYTGGGGPSCPDQEQCLNGRKIFLSGGQYSEIQGGCVYQGYQDLGPCAGGGGGGGSTTCNNGKNVGDQWPECHGCDEGLVTCNGGDNYGWQSVRNPSPNCGSSCGGSGGSSPLPSASSGGGGRSCVGYAQNCVDSQGKAGTQWCQPGMVLPNGSCGYDPSKPPPQTKCYLVQGSSQEGCNIQGTQCNGGMSFSGSCSAKGLTVSWDLANIYGGDSCNIYLRGGTRDETISKACSGSKTITTFNGQPLANGGIYEFFVSNGNTSGNCYNVSKGKVTIPCGATSPSPTASPRASSSPTSSPGGGGGGGGGGGTTVVTTAFRVAESLAGLTNAPWEVYTGDGMVRDYEIQDKNPGMKQIWVEFKTSDGRTGGCGTNGSQPCVANIRLLGAEPTISSCGLIFEGSSVVFDIKGTNLGSAKGSAKSGDKGLTVREWSDSSAKVVMANPPVGQIFPITLTNADGQSAEGQCSAISTISLGAKVFCRRPSEHDTDNVDLVLVGLFEGGQKIRETVRIDKNGIIQNLTQRLEEGRKYALSLKAPLTLRRTVEIIAGKGVTIVPNFILPVGDIFPKDGGDGSINSFDKSELDRQWIIALPVTGRTGDFNRDTRVNSVDWACMRYDFGLKDDPEPSPGAVATSPSPRPSPSLIASPSATPAGGACIQVITPAKNPQTGECKDFPTPCDVPTGWQIVSSCSTN